MNAAIKFFRTASIFLLILILNFSIEAQTLAPISRLSSNAAGEGGNADTGSGGVSASGKFLAFASQASNLVANDTNGVADVFIRNIQTGEVQRVNIGPNGEEANDTSRRGRLTAVNPNGYFAVVYDSDATNIGFATAIPDNNDAPDIYFTLPTRGYTERVSLGVNKTPADGSSSEASATAIAEPNKLMVAYTSAATNLISSDQNNFNDIFLTTIETPEGISLDAPSNMTTVRVSQRSDGGESDGPSRSAIISGDGNWVVFESDATNLIPGINVSGSQIYLYEVATANITLISGNSVLTGGDGNSTAPNINFDGKYVVYSSRASNIVNDGKSSDAYQVFRYNRTNGVTERINVSSAGEAGNGVFANGVSTSISPNGRYVIFSDSATNLVAGDSNGRIDVFVKDTITGSLSLISRGFDGSFTDADSTSPALAGQSYNSNTALCVFSSNASNIIAGDNDGRNDLFLAPFTVGPNVFTRASTLDVPPDVSVAGRSLAVAIEKFKGVDLKKLAAFIEWVQRSIQKKVKLTIRYQIEATNVTPNTISDVRKRNSKKNQFAIGNLKPNSIYSVRSRVQVMNGTRVKFSSQFSPPQRIATTQ